MKHISYSVGMLISKIANWGEENVHMMPKKLLRCVHYGQAG